ncbi:probable homogentisate phytyltransferase 1, chloroplastic [Dendrobium catenatum]|uniref:probable homogentisate phytyltransferase 1, chloroplastic n=1 Tax=Dendrobium catenatum TaxID=906689 RepID=UPI00109FE82B|nr:probable homogentisate phytyltransferase 1, chloroplastic [Dendrobium catenatum]
MHTNPRTRPTLQRQPLARICARRITAMMSIIANLGIVLQISTFLHTQTFVLGRQANFSKPLILGTIVVSIFSVVIALFKDVPDIEGDKKFGIRSLAASLGPKKVLWICICLLEMVYIFAIVFGATSSRPWSKLINISSHSALGLILWKQSGSIDLKDKFSLQSFYMLIWKLLYAEYMLLPLVR